MKKKFNIKPAKGPVLRDPPPELDLRKGIHVKLLPDTRVEFRIMAMRAHISMQELLEEFAQRCVAQDPYCLNLIEDIVKRKREKKFEQLSETDAESLFKELEFESPFNE